jgi:hypothetical protein
MQTFRRIVIGLSLSMLATGLQSGFAENATIQTFTNSIVEQVDPGTKKLTFRTLEGQTWSLDVHNSDLLKGLQKGDRVSLELDSDDRIKNVVRGEEHGDKGPQTKPVEGTRSE